MGNQEKPTLLVAMPQGCWWWLAMDRKELKRASRLFLSFNHFQTRLK